MRNTYALLIAGDEKRFVEAVDFTRRYLLYDAGFDEKKTWTCNHSTNESVLKTIERFVQEVNAEKLRDAVVVYKGHGLQGSFCPNVQEKSVSYGYLARTLKKIKGRTVFINDSCYSGSCIPVFRESGILPEAGLVITSSSESELSYSNFFNYVLRGHFKHKLPYLPKKHAFDKNPWIKDNIVYQHPQRCGLSLDHLLFPQ